MERRVLYAIFLSLIVVYTYQLFVVKPVPKPAATSNAAAGATSGAAAAAATPALTAPIATPTAAALVADVDARDIRVETRNVIAIFTNRGARLKSWRLKRFFDHDKQPQELIEAERPNQPLPFTLRTTNDQTTAALNGALYRVSGVPAAVLESGAADVTFEYRDASGLEVTKSFHFEGESYVVGVSVSVRNGGGVVPASILWGPAVGDVVEVSRYVQQPEGILFHDGKVQRLAAGDIAKQPVHDGAFKYAGVDDNYFMTVAFVPGASKVTYEHLTVPTRDPKTPRELVAYAIEPQQQGPVKFFIGPKDFDVLSAIDRDLANAINFGYFAVIVVPLLRSLKWVYSYVGNYGWSIVILTVIINAIMFPLRHKSVVSMRRMQEIQPEVKAIQDRYAKYKATDPEKQKMNQELMALYRERGVNPAGGCVPMLLTFPILFAMWALLSTAIELRGAPFFGWIHDLTAHDPYYITPILMGGTTIWQQRITPAAGVDPAQQKMMMMMPIVFTVMFLWLPAGAVVYYFVTNLWGIGQQYLTSYLIGPPKIRTVRPAAEAERRLKRVGGGKSEAAAREQP